MLIVQLTAARAKESDGDSIPQVSPHRQATKISWPIAVLMQCRSAPWSIGLSSKSAHGFISELNIKRGNMILDIDREILGLFNLGRGHSSLTCFLDE
jgi:hypothetical protein